MKYRLALFAYLLTMTAGATVDSCQYVPTIKTGYIVKRKGGGVGGGRGGRGGRGGKSGPNSPGSNRSPDSNRGGTSPGGSGPRPAYGGGRFYGGGAQTPFPAGSSSPVGNIVPFAVSGAAALAFWPGIWLWGAWMYPFHDPYHFYNLAGKRNETCSVLCGCSMYAVCGCDDNNNTEYFESLIGNGSYAALNRTLIQLTDVDGIKTILINGTLPNGTTADGPVSHAAASMQDIVETLGLWAAIAAALVTVFLA